MLQKHKDSKSHEVILCESSCLGVLVERDFAFSFVCITTNFVLYALNIGP